MRGLVFAEVYFSLLELTAKIRFFEIQKILRFHQTR